MKLTTRGEYALLALVAIARQHPKYVRGEEICAAYGFSKKYLEQILAEFKKFGFLRTKRGVSGGYGLAKEADKIVLAHVVRTIDGPLAPSKAVSVYFYEATPLEKEPKLKGLFKEIRDYISNKMENLTIADFI